MVQSRIIYFLGCFLIENTRNCECQVQKEMDSGGRLAHPAQTYFGRDAVCFLVQNKCFLNGPKSQITTLKPFGSEPYPQKEGRMWIVLSSLGKC